MKICFLQRNERNEKQGEPKSGLVCFASELQFWGMRENGVVKAHAEFYGVWGGKTDEENRRMPLVLWKLGGVAKR